MGNNNKYINQMQIFKFIDINYFIILARRSKRCKRSKRCSADNRHKT